MEAHLDNRFALLRYKNHTWFSRLWNALLKMAQVSETKSWPLKIARGWWNTEESVILVSWSHHRCKLSNSKFEIVTFLLDYGALLSPVVYTLHWMEMVKVIMGFYINSSKLLEQSFSAFCYSRIFSYGRKQILQMPVHNTLPLCDNA